MIDSEWRLNKYQKKHAHYFLLDNELFDNVIDSAENENNFYQTVSTEWFESKTLEHKTWSGHSYKFLKKLKFLTKNL